MPCTAFLPTPVESLTPCLHQSVESIGLCPRPRASQTGAFGLFAFWTAARQLLPRALRRATGQLHAQRTNWTARPTRRLRPQSSQKVLTRNWSRLWTSNIVRRDSNRKKIQNGDIGGFDIYTANVADEHLLRNANVTWMGKGQVIFQRSSQSLTHYTFITHSQLPFEQQQWHRSLAPAFAQKILTQTFYPKQHAIAENFQDGRRAYIGDACYAQYPSFLESHNSGIEDAWVLSRMMENYEEDIGDGLREYERYRRPRAVRVAQSRPTCALIPLPDLRWIRVFGVMWIKHYPHAFCRKSPCKNRTGFTSTT